MKQDNLRDEFESFYMELPQADYLNDLTDISIQYEHNDDSSDARGLSDEQVSKLANDTLDAAPQPTQDASSSDNLNLFPKDKNAN